MNKNSNLLRRLEFALDGIIEAWFREKSLRTQSLAAIAVVSFCLVMHPPLVWTALFILSTALVLALELLNSALEALLDRLYPEWHPEIKFIKDALAGAVLIASIAAVGVFICYLFISHQ